LHQELLKPDFYPSLFLALTYKNKHSESGRHSRFSPGTCSPPDTSVLLYIVCLYVCVCFISRSPVALSQAHAAYPCRQGHYLEKNPSQKRTGGMAQDVGPELKPQYEKKKKKY
jgi:hypothetical protein